MEGRALPEAIENALRALFCEKNGFNMGVNGRGLVRFSFRPKSPQKGRGHLKHDFRLTERLLPDSTMTYRGRSDGLVVESDRKKIITFKFTCHLRDLEGYFVYTSGGFFFSFSFSPRQCVTPIALMDKPPLCVCLCVCLWVCNSVYCAYKHDSEYVCRSVCLCETTWVIFT